MKTLLRNKWLIVTLLPFILFICAFQLLPLAVMITSSFQTDGGESWSLVQYITALGNKYYLQALKNSLLISFGSSGAAIVIALFAAYSITRFSPKTRDVLIMISNMTHNFSGVPLAFAFLILLGTNGLFTLLFNELGLDNLGTINLYSWLGLILVYIYFQLPLAILLLYPTYYGIQEQWKEAAALLGASPSKFWRYIGFPVILPGVVGTFSILFANAMGAYSTAYALVGGKYNLMTIRIGSLVGGDIVARPELAGALAVVLAISMVSAMLINERMIRRVRRDLR